jgi:hypothetical protein
MLLAGLLGVCASNDLGTCRKHESDPNSIQSCITWAIASNGEGSSYHSRSLVGRGNYGELQVSTAYGSDLGVGL